MNPRHLSKAVWLYASILILCGLGYARYDTYRLDGDAVAFMDIADALHAHDLAHAANGYWNPLYPAVLLVGEFVAHPSRWDELQTFYTVNFFVFVLCVFACVSFVRSLAAVRDHLVPAADGAPALSTAALSLIALGLLFASFQRELAIGAVRSDSLLLLLFLLAASFILRLQAGGRFVHYPLLGAALGLAYLTKSFAFLPSALVLTAMVGFGLTRKSAQRRRILGGAVLAGMVFAALAGPYIAAISHQRGRLTTGESARLNYAFFIDQTARWHEAHSGDLGHATASFRHPEQVLLDSPAVYSYAQHPVGTYPLWFDPAYWTEGIQPKLYLRGHIQRLARNVALLARYVLGHLESLVVLGVLLLAGSFFSRRRASWMPMLPVMLLGLLVFAIYLPIDFQDRYLTTGLLLLTLPVFAMLRRPANGFTGEAATATALLLALLMAANAIADLAERRRYILKDGYPRGAYSLQIYPAARALNAMGLGHDQPVACFGDRACYIDHYWARLAETPIRAEIEVPNSGDPGAFWQTVQDKQVVFDTLKARHIAAIVAVFEPAAHMPEGWTRLNQTNFYVYPLNPPSAAP